MDNLGSSPILHGGFGVETSKEHSAQSDPIVQICENCKVLHTLLTYATPEGERRCACLFENLEEVVGTSKAVINPYFWERSIGKDVSGNFNLPTETIESFEDLDGNVEGAVGGVATDGTKNEDDVFTPNEEVETQGSNEVIKCTMNVCVCVQCADVSEQCSPFFLGKTLGFVCRHFSPVHSDTKFNGEEIFRYFGSGKDFSKQIKSLETQLHDVNNEKALIHSNWNSTMDEVRFLRGEVQKKDAEIRNLTEKLHNSVAENKKLSKEIDTCRTELNKLNSKYIELSNVSDVELRRQSATKDVVIGNLTAELSKNGVDLQNLRVEINQMRIEIQQYRSQLRQEQKRWAEKEQELRNKIVTNTEADQRVREFMGKVNQCEIEIKRLKGERQVGCTSTSATRFTIKQDDVVAERTTLFGPQTPVQPENAATESSSPTNHIGTNSNEQVVAADGQKPVSQPRPTRKSSYHLYNSLKHFSGSADYTFEEFVANFENARLVGNWAEDEVCPLFKGALNGEPFKKMLRIEKREGASLKFESVKEEFSRLYGDPATKTTFFEKFCALKCKDSESVRNFSQRAEEYFTKAFPENGGDPDMLKSRFIKGLPERIADKVENRNPKTFKEALTAAIEIEQRFAEKEKPVFEVAAIKYSPKEKVELSPQVIRLLNSLVDESAQQSAPTAGFSTRRTASKSEVNETGARPRFVCAYCNKPGHRTEFCFTMKKDLEEKAKKTANSNLNPESKSYVPRDNITCYKCNQPGHIEKNCPAMVQPLNDNDHTE
jgi:TolA-binding protein